MAVSCYIGLGSNVGRRSYFLRAALGWLSEVEGITLVRCSGVVQTPALLPENAPDAWDMAFLNQVAEIRTTLSPETLLDALKACEDALGRRVRGRWGPREIDCDLLLYGDEVYRSQRLCVPHSDLAERDFVLVPLAELAPDLKVAGTDKTVRALLGALPEVVAKPYVVLPEIMGILNVTPDSFSDGGSPVPVEERLLHMIQAGAHWVDIGAESTRPGAAFVHEEEEWARLMPVLSHIRDVYPKRTWRVSVDSYHAATIRRALDMGVDCINDVCGGRDRAVLDAMAGAGVDYIAMHSLSVPADPAKVLPQSADILHEMQRWAACVIDDCLNAGISSSRLILDPGIGFGKTALHSLELVLHMEELVRAMPQVRWLAGHSRKSFLRLLQDKPPAERDGATFACSAMMMESGVDIVRVHDVPLHHLLVEQWRRV